MSGKNNNSGMSFLQGLTIGFIMLKHMGDIDWSWWLVLSPFLLEFTIVFFVVFSSNLISACKKDQ